MTIAVDLGRKATKQTNKTLSRFPILTLADFFEIVQILTLRRTYTHCIHVNTDFKAQQMLPTDQLQVFALSHIGPSKCILRCFKHLFKCEKLLSKQANALLVTR